MRQPALLALIVLVLGAACGQEKVPEKKSPSPFVEPFVDRQNLLDLTRGAIVVHRTGELRLGLSAMQAIDGSDATSWSTPPGDTRQAVTIELPLPARLTQVGFSTAALVDKGRAAKEIAFESSSDGVTFEKLATATFAKTGDRQTVDVARECRFLRATLMSNYGNPQGTDVLSLVAYGEQTGQPARNSLTGEWMLNRTRASLVERDGRVRGEVQMNPTMFIDGSWDGSVIRFIWIRGDKQFGVGMVAVNPKADRLNSVWFFEEAFPIFAGESWFGEKRATEASVAEKNVVEEGFIRAGRVPIYDHQMSLDELTRVIRQNASRRLKFVAHEFRGETAAENRRRAAADLGQLKSALESRGVDVSGVEFVVGGSDQWQKPASTMETVMFSRIILETAK